jgi:hypothetical protein
MGLDQRAARVAREMVVVAAAEEPVARERVQKKAAGRANAEIAYPPVLNGR